MSSPVLVEREAVDHEGVAEQVELLACVALAVGASEPEAVVERAVDGLGIVATRIILGSWRDGYSGALQMGAKNGAWCVGCCWALMLALFALGIMSVIWMAVVAGFIAVEKTLPWRRVATQGTAAILLGLALLVLIAPGHLPGFTTPGSSTMHEMPSMGS